jgi:CheY-like chemotaxis protein
MIVALTAFALHEEEQKTVMAGCDMHLSKPVKKQTLLDCIQSIAVSRPLKKIS